MSFLKNIFAKKETPIQSYPEFWNWFVKNEKQFHKVVKERKNIEKYFFDKISPKLNELKEGFFYVTGMYDDNTVELILTADGIIKNIAFVEELVMAAPAIKGWKFTALKPPLNIKDVSISMGGLDFDSNNLSFYPNEHAGYPDEIDITIVYADFDEEKKELITNGIYIFLDNFLGELNAVTTIDGLSIMGKKDATADLIPISKLKDFLTWRQKEFIEKYEGTRHDTENDNYSILEAQLKSGNNLIAIINTDLIKWEEKGSHPWAACMEIKYDGKNNNGMPDEETYALLQKIEDDILYDLKDVEGYLNIGRQTAEGSREIYFACKDFRKPSKVFHHIASKYSGRAEISFDIFKDKYWQTFERFNSSLQQ